MKKKALVEWDYGATGLWLVTSPNEDSELQDLNRHFSNREGASGWRDLISPTLLLELDNWSVVSSEISRRVPELTSSPLLQERLRSTQIILANRVREELDSREWEVLYSDHSDGWAWTWVGSPWE